MRNMETPAKRGLFPKILHLRPFSEISARPGRGQPPGLIPPLSTFEGGHLHHSGRTSA